MHPFAQLALRCGALGCTVRPVSADGERTATDSTRQSARVAIDAFVKVSGGHGDGEFVFRTRDLSESGLFLYTRVAHTYPIRVGTTLQLELHEFDDVVSCQVVVVRVVQPGSIEATQYPAGFGVRISAIGQAERDKLREMIRRAS
jgi:hypothetical protein